MTDVEIDSSVLSSAVVAQVQNYDTRFAKGIDDKSTANPSAQTAAFGQRDATGVESVHDVMPTESAVFNEMLMEAAKQNSLLVAENGAESCEDRKTFVSVLDFGCGDGRYLKQFLRSAEALYASYSFELRVVAYEVSLEALKSFHHEALQAGLQESTLLNSSPKKIRKTVSSPAGLPALSGKRLNISFVHGDGNWTAAEVGQTLLLALPGVFDFTVIGWGTLSCIPHLDGLNPDTLLQSLAKVGKTIMNVASTSNNHIKFQKQSEARRQAFIETTRPAARKWLQSRIGLASFPGSYYYKVDTGQHMFYHAVTADEEVSRLSSNGFRDVRLKICNVINFFDIQTKPRAARINAAVIKLLERNNLWGAQLLLCRLVARFNRVDLATLRCNSCIFDSSSPLAAKGQVARYFISTGVSDGFPTLAKM